jgi:uncharacterized damage-inducible protein DinB
MHIDRAGDACSTLEALDGAMNEVLLHLYRHKTCATLRLIDYCQGVGDEHLDATIPGTYGTIRETLRHLVEAEEWYLSILTPGSPDPLPDGPVPLDEPRRAHPQSRPALRILAQDPDLPGREVATDDGWRMPGAIVMAQAIHHAESHRTHVMSILGARGLHVPEPSDLDVWGYADTSGITLEPEQTPSA